MDRIFVDAAALFSSQCSVGCSAGAVIVKTARGPGVGWGRVRCPCIVLSASACAVVQSDLGLLFSSAGVRRVLFTDRRAIFDL